MMRNPGVAGDRL